MNAYDVLKAFGEYIDYDPEQTHFNLLSYSYVYHSAGKVIGQICDNYDPTGRMAVLYAKRVYSKVISDSRVKMIDLLTHEEEYLAEKRMYDLFHSEEVNKIEKEYLDALTDIIIKMTGKQEIGERDPEKETETLYEAIESVVEQLGKCIEDVYVSSGRPVEKVDNVSTKIHLFNYMADCVLTLQNSAPDGVYFCYINNNGTADGYFAIVIKSNGNLFSVNDRVPEAYIGQHTNSRNNRWAEGHQGIFPYNYIITLENFDYKGYAHKYNIDEDKLSFKDLEASAYIPIILSILCVMNSRVGKVLDEKKLVYMNSMIRSNIEQSAEKNALIALDKTGLIQATTNALDIKFDREKFLNGDYANEFAPNRESGHNQVYVDLYARDFTPGVKTLSVTARNALMSGEDFSEPHAEFIGSLDKMRRQAYYESRIELADYIRKEMKKELEASGGIKGVYKWFYESMRENMATLMPTIAYVYKCHLDKGKYGYHNENDPDWIKNINVIEKTDPYFYDNVSCYNEPHIEHVYGDRYRTTHYLCPISGNKANIWIEFRACNWEDIEKFIGKPVIKILKNWRSEYYKRVNDVFYGGNPILDSVDAVDFLSPFERKDYIRFNYYIGFSKRGMNRLLKENGLWVKKDEKGDK